MHHFDLCENKELENFYTHCFLTTPCSKNIKELLGGETDEYKLYMAWRKEGVRESNRLDRDIKQILAESLKEHYTNITARVERMIKNPYQVISDNGQVSDIILFDFFRFVKNEDFSDVPQKSVISVYVRKDLKSHEIGDLKNDWVMINLYYLRKEGFLCERSLNNGVYVLKSYLYVYATFAEFFDGGDLSIYPHLSSAKKWFTYEIFMKFSTNAVVDLNKDFDYRGVLEKLNVAEYILVERIAGLVEILNYSAEPLWEELNGKLLHIYTELKSFFDVKQWGKAEAIYNKCWGIFHFDDHSLTAKIKTNLFLENSKNLIITWRKEDNNKLAYLFIQLIRYKNLFARNFESDFFSYDKLVVANTENLQIGQFPSKKTVRRFFNLEENTFLIVMSQVSDTYSYISSITFWRNIMIYLDGDYDFTHLNYEAINRAKKEIGNLYKLNSNELLDQDVSRHIGKSVELLLQQGSNEVRINPENEELLQCNGMLGELCDYLNGREYVRDGDGIKRTYKKNIKRIGKKTSVDRLIINTKKWHKDIQDYQILNKSKSKSISKQYEHIDDIEITIDNCVFKAIPDRSRLSAEGVKLKHCISEYHSKCLNKSYVAFSVKDNSDYAVSGSKSNQNKYTLGLQVAQRSNGDYSLVYDQCCGYQNKFAPTHVMTAVKQLINKLYCNSCGFVSLNIERKP